MILSPPAPQAGSVDAPIHLLLLPGLDGTDVFLRPLLTRLPPRIVTTVIEYPDKGPYGYDALLRLVARRVLELPHCHVLACSFSGPLAAMLAAAMPEQVRGVIFVATFLSSPRPALRPLRPLIRGPLVWALRVQRRLPVWARPKSDGTRIAKRETWARVSARALAGRARAVLGVDARPFWRDCRVPALCVVYAGDAVVPRRWSAEIIEGRPDARLVTLPGGHLGMFDAPQALADAVLSFVAGSG